MALACPAVAQPGGFKQGGDKGGKGWWNKTPEERFKDIAKGKDHIVIAEMPGFFRPQMEKYAQENGITDGKLTLQQYLNYAEAAKKKMEKGGMFQKGNPQGKPLQGGGGPPPTFGGGQPLGPGVAWVEGTTFGGEKTHTARFKAGVKYTIRLRRLQQQPHFDPYLYLYDPDGQLVAQDDDGDGNLNSKIVYTPTVNGLFMMKCTGLGGSAGKYQLSIEGGEGIIIGPAKLVSGPSQPDVVNLDDLEERPVVYAGSKLPPGLPAWFAELDTDKDGQIGLYEWLAAKKSLAEFKAMDRNQDGFLTPDEVFYYLYGDTDPTSASAEPRNTGQAIAGDKSGKGKFPGFSKKGGVKGIPIQPGN
jgi:hypothetical protein